jgi:hypothetical protein
MTCAKLGGMLEQGPATAVIHPPECVPARGRVPPAAAAGPRGRRPGARAYITVLASALLALGPGCSLLLDFDLPAIDAAIPIDAAAPDAQPIDAATPDAQQPIDAPPAGPDGAPADDAAPMLILDER